MSKQTEPKDKPYPELRSTQINRIPKNLLIKLLGVIHNQQKFKLMRNIIFIINYLFVSKDFTEKFDAILKRITEA